jgi:hypothetical protein
MKNDHSFKLLAAIVFAGVIVAFITPSQAVPQSDRTPSETTSIVHQAE